ncbi:hypothetical protein EHP00_1676 [Ecytonucleospora hepatopenaei]|uniref:Uncharacterized protein n=1 Tax=Ecytonucleospora hepatopenaei TaxID=646526 RepID=A0A1W0E308_9MICR|nr:hypothetical protein EHP00_1676 [Ecytonucleospora hepatopenaei]
MIILNLLNITTILSAQYNSNQSLTKLDLTTTFNEFDPFKYGVVLDCVDKTLEKLNLKITSLEIYKKLMDLTYQLYVIRKETSKIEEEHKLKSFDTANNLKILEKIYILQLQRGRALKDILSKTLMQMFVSNKKLSYKNKIKSSHSSNYIGSFYRLYKKHKKEYKVAKSNYIYTCLLLKHYKKLNMDAEVTKHNIHSLLKRFVERTKKIEIYSEIFEYGYFCKMLEGLVVKIEQIINTNL